MKNIEYLNELIKREVLKTDNCVLFGQNINAGSCLGGLTRNIKLNSTSKIFNSTNAENSLVGFGFGLLMNGATGVFFMKQLDFLLLGIDHLVNTYNIIRSLGDTYPNGSFTIVATVVDSGYEGPQSSFNNLYDLCEIGHVNGFTVTNRTDAEYMFSRHFLKPGFRIIALSQRLGKEAVSKSGEPVKKIIGDGDIFQYKEGKDVTIVSFNFSFPQAVKLVEFLKANGVHASHFNVNSVTPASWEAIIADISITKRVILIDDSKSIQFPGDHLLSMVCDMEVNKKIVLKKQLQSDWLYPVSDIFDIDHDDVLRQLIGIVVPENRG